MLIKKGKYMKRPIEQLLEIMSKLRSESGCGWDKKQTLLTLKKYLLEETYELLDAIDNLEQQENEAAINHHKEELGDVLFQVIFQSEIQSEKKHFSFDDVVTTIVDKLVRRHPHIFGDEHCDADTMENPFWQEIKQQELKEKKQTVMASVAKSMPSLMRAAKLGDKAALLAFDWANVHDAWEKVEEEVWELKEALATDDVDHQREELGDLLFAVSQIARKLNLDPELVLHQGNEKFIKRFDAMIEKIGGEENFKALSPSEKEELWQHIKK